MGFAHGSLAWASDSSTWTSMSANRRTSCVNRPDYSATDFETASDHASLRPFNFRSIAPFPSERRPSAHLGPPWGVKVKRGTLGHCLDGLITPYDAA
jgi:hypothetical protein